MAKKLFTPPPAPSDLPICFHPGCRERAPYGFGCTLRSFGQHYCGKHRPNQPSFVADEPQAAEVRRGS
ncbi:hypothetical protein [Methylobacterium sp. Leaf85]|uniref:hypothetical protein n=1 Tax=Methylobacterium sp. Leaf85 TaxID=1736241 RepID=UPI0006F8C5A0|nr:hypothetical protein [Methylobacterium sp. Leaf85]KQO53093.1 hypothetical protein ASF08_19405 [Methylobacterium sp. Leaf85]